MSRTETIDNCPCCGNHDCPCCTGATPAVIKGTIAGVIAKSPVDCEDCLSWNRTWNLKHTPGTCKWVACLVGDIFNSNCNNEPLPCDDGVPFPMTDIQAYLVSGCPDPETTIDVNIHQNGSSPALFAKTVVGKADCFNMGVIPLFNGSDTFKCDWRNATCTLGH